MPTSTAGWTPLHLACQDVHKACALLLVEAGADANKGDDEGYTPLYFACWSGHEACARLLVETGADASKAGDDGRTPRRWPSGGATMAVRCCSATTSAAARDDAIASVREREATLLAPTVSRAVVPVDTVLGIASAVARCREAVSGVRAAGATRLVEAVGEVHGSPLAARHAGGGAVSRGRGHTA